MSYLKNKDTINNKVHIKSTKDISGKQSLLMIPLAKFFSVKNNMDKLLNVLNGNSRISLRLIDWFVTNYAKKHNIMYIISDYNNNNINKKKKKTKKKEKEIKAAFSNYFSVFHNYKLQLKEVSKKHFDPFCRRTRINFYYDTLNENKYILTTVGQLNFFKWAIENNILEYIEESFEEIEDDMNENSKTPKSKKINKKDGEVEDGNCFKDGKDKKKSNSIKDKKGKTKKKSPGSTHRKKRKELSSSASKSIIRHNYPTVIKFD